MASISNETGDNPDISLQISDAVGYSNDVKRLFSAALIAIGVISLLFIGYTGLSLWAVYRMGDTVKNTAKAFVVELMPDWNKETFSKYASPNLRKTNPKFADHLEVIHREMGELKSFSTVEVKNVSSQKEVPKGIEYFVDVEIQCTKGKATMNLGMAEYPDGFRLTRFMVSDKR
ncbi:MAG: hypothetical protein J0L72_07285 [Armatimonadetes bacterium]|nr:hypothetical protein [Armatimonadota bacterium]